jgi:glucosamine kinase
MAYYLAVDAGGTKAEFLLAEERREVARATCGTIKRLNATEDEAARHLEEALAHLTAKTGLRMDQVACTCIGTSGNTVPLVTDWLRGNFARRVSGSLLILGDVEIALDAVFPGERGILALAGTGSNVAGRGDDGKIVTAGGWGPMLADQGAGYWIGLEALRRGFLALDEQRPTCLLEQARDLWHLPSVAALIEFANAEPRPQFAEFVPRVVAAAASGDALAAAILKQGGEDLAYVVHLVLDRILRAESGRHPLPAVAIAGSILGKVEPLRNALVAWLREHYPQIQFVHQPADPVLGALYRARQSKNAGA